MIILFILLSWAIIATLIYLQRVWSRKLTLKGLSTKLLFVFVVNFLLCPVCVYFNIRYFLTRKAKVKAVVKCSPQYSFVTQHSR